MAVITGTSGNDALSGTSLSDIIYGLEGDDTLDGGGGQDFMFGGLGNDTFIVDRIGDLVIEGAGQGIDVVRATAGFTLPDNVENLVLLGTAAIDGIGNELANVITGNARNNVLHGLGSDDTLIGGAGSDKLDGGGGADTMIGGTGDDTYFVDLAGDVVVENARGGADLVLTSSDFALPSQVENAAVLGPAGRNVTGNGLDNIIQGAVGGGDDVLSGGDGNDVLVGSNGNDTLRGDAGVDLLIGGTGNDTYFVDAAGDQVVDAFGQGVDVVFASASHALEIGDEIETLQLVGADSINATGNEFTNTLIGNDGNNALSSGGNNDQMIGNAGNDAFVYRLGDEVDLISDFTGAGVTLGDFIVLDDFGIAGFNDLLPLISDVAGGCQIQFNASDVLVLAGVSKAQLDASDFVFT